MAGKISDTTEYVQARPASGYSESARAAKESPQAEARVDLIAGCADRLENGSVGIAPNRSPSGVPAPFTLAPRAARGGKHWPEDVGRTVLENGVCILTERIPSAKSVSIGFVLEASPRDERDGEYGLAHMCEHMMFRGTSSRNAFEIARHIDQAGGSIGAFTSRDYTCYYACVPDDHTYHAIDLMGDILLNATFPEQSLEREKAVTACELGAQRDVPSDWVHSRMKAACWPAASLGRPIAGDPEDIAGLTREDVIYFVHRNYTPDRMIIAAAGNLAHEDFVAQCRDAFWRLIGEGARPAPPTPAAQGGLHIDTIDSAQAYFSLGVPTVAYADPARYAAHLLVRVLGGGVSSRLYHAVREERGLAYDVGAQYEAYRDAGLFVIRGSAQPERIAGALDVIYRELDALSAGRRPVDEEELAIAKTQVRGAHVISGGDVFTRMSRLATQQLYFGQPIGDAEILAAIEAVTLDQINGFATQELQFGLAEISAAVAGPRQAAAQQEQIAAQLDGLRASCAARAVCPCEPADTWRQADASRPPSQPHVAPLDGAPLVAADADPEFLVRRGLVHDV